MVQTIKAKSKLSRTRNVYRPLVITGYAAFLSIVVATLLSTTIPLGVMLFDPAVLRMNVATIALALTVGSVLPVVLGYIIGDHAVRSKAKLDHHFNGVLFGLLSFWVMLFVGFAQVVPSEIFQDQNARIVMLNIFPGIVAALISSVLAVMHVRGRQAKTTVLEYKPFVITLVMATVVLPSWSLVNSILAHSCDISWLLTLAMTIGLGFVSYVTLRSIKLGRFLKIAWSTVSVSVAYVAMYASSQLVHTLATALHSQPSMEEQAMVGWIGFGLAAAAWLVYWIWQVRALR